MKYPTLDTIEEYYNFLAEEYPSLCRVHTIGYTAENRTIKVGESMAICSSLNAAEWLNKKVSTI